MTTSIYARKKKEKLIERAVRLYKSGMSFRDVSKALNVSHEWVRKAYLSTIHTASVDKN
jgi:transposase-like protein